MKFSDLKMRPDVMVYQAFNIYLRHVRNGMIGDAEGKLLAAAQVLDVAQAPRDAVCLAFLCPMPPEAHDRLARGELRGREYLMDMAREWQQLVEDDFRGVQDATDEVKAVVLAVETARLQRFTMEMQKWEADRRANRLDSPYVPIFEDMGKCETLLDRATGGEGNLGIDLLFKAALEEAQPHYEAGVRLVRRLGLYNPEAAQERLAERAPFEETRLLREPVVQKAYEIAGGAPLVRSRDFGAAVETGELLSAVPLVTGSTVAAALVDLALRGRGPEYPPWLDLGADVARTLKDISIHAMEEPGEVKKATAEFRQILLAQAAQMLRKDICEGRWLLQHTARGGLAGLADLREAFNDFAEKRDYLRAFVLPAAGKTGAPALDRLFRRRYEAFTRMLEKQGKQQKGRKPTP